jgi:hypothetical protein
MNWKNYSISTRWLIIGLLTITGTGLLWLGPGRWLIMALYNHPNIPLLGDLMGGRDVHPVDRYLGVAASMVRHVLLGMGLFVSIGAIALNISSGSATRRKAWFALFLLIMISVLIRLPHLSKPLQYEQPLANSLITLSILWEDGVVAHYGGMPRTFPGDANRFAKNLGITAHAPDGQGYYLTFPPFALHVAYAVLKTLDSPPSPTNLRALAVAWHVLGIVATFLLMRQFFRTHASRDAIAWWSTLCVALAPTTLWHFGEVYSPDTIWQHLMVISLLLLMGVMHRWEQQKTAKLWFSLWLISIFLVTYTDNHGALFAALTGIWSLMQLRRSRRYSLIFIGAALSSSLAVLITYLQYSAILGGSLHQLFIDTAARRTFAEGGSWSNMGLYYLRSYWPFGMGILFLAWSFRGDQRPRLTSSIWIVMPLLIVLHAAIFLNWTLIHGLSAIKAAYPIGLLLGYLLTGKKWLPLETNASTQRALTLAILAGFLATASYAQYRAHYTFDRAREKNQRIANQILADADPTENLFQIGPVPVLPQILYYAKRNMHMTSSETAAIKWMEQHQRTRGRIFYFDEQREIISNKTLSVTAPTTE